LFLDWCFDYWLFVVGFEFWFGVGSECISCSRVVCSLLRFLLVWVFMFIVLMLVSLVVVRCFCVVVRVVDGLVWLLWVMISRLWCILKVFRVLRCFCVCGI